MPEQRLVRALRPWQLADAPRERLAGDVSRRQYFRIHVPTEEHDSSDPTVVGMVTPLTELHKMRDWVAVGRYLAGHGIAVPRVLCHDMNQGVLLIEDVGDCLLVEQTDPAVADGWTAEVLAQLARLELAAADEPSTTSPAHGRLLEEDRLRWELRRFRKVVAGAVAPLSDAELEHWKRGEDAIVAAFRAAPKSWMHRDLHGRNILLHHDRAVWIDFQDAMMGPWLYDLVSMVYDPYSALPEDRRQALIEGYLSLPQRIHAHVPAAVIEPLLALTTAQRLIHCAACYVWVHEHDGRDTYLQYLPFTLTELRRALDRCPAAAPLAEVMASRWDGVWHRWAADAVGV